MSVDQAISRLRQRPLTLPALAAARQTCVEYGIKPTDIDLAIIFLEQGDEALAIKYIAGPSPRKPSPGAIVTMEAAKQQHKRGW